LLKHRDVKATARKSQSGGQAADAGAGDNDIAWGRQDTRSF
jgi:hypothetical protein